MWEALESIFSSRGRETGVAGPQAQRPLGGQRKTRSDKRGGHIPNLENCPESWPCRVLLPQK